MILGKRIGSKCDLGASSDKTLWTNRNLINPPSLVCKALRSFAKSLWFADAVTRRRNRPQVSTKFTWQLKAPLATSRRADKLNDVGKEVIWCCSSGIQHVRDAPRPKLSAGRKGGARRPRPKSPKTPSGRTGRTFAAAPLLGGVLNLICETMMASLLVSWANVNQ